MPFKQKEGGKQGTTALAQFCTKAEPTQAYTSFK